MSRTNPLLKPKKKREKDMFLRSSTNPCKARVKTVETGLSDYQQKFRDFQIKKEKSFPPIVTCLCKRTRHIELGSMISFSGTWYWYIRHFATEKSRSSGRIDPGGERVCEMKKHFTEQSLRHGAVLGGSSAVLGIEMESAAGQESSLSTVLSLKSLMCWS